MVFIVFVFCMVAVLMAATFTVGALAAFRIGCGRRAFDLSTGLLLIGAFVLGGGMTLTGNLAQST